jgi:hypothetical protein
MEKFLIQIGKVTLNLHHVVTVVATDADTLRITTTILTRDGKPHYP